MDCRKCEINNNCPGFEDCPYMEKRMATHRITDIHRNYRKPGIIYARLTNNETNEVEICATLDYILDAIKERGYTVDEAGKDVNDRG